MDDMSGGDAQLMQDVADGARVKEFIDDPAVKRAFERVEQKFFNEIRRAVTDDQRLAAAIGIQALEQIAVALLGTTHRAVLAEQEIARKTPPKKGR